MGDNLEIEILVAWFARNSSCISSNWMLFSKISHVTLDNIGPFLFSFRLVACSHFCFSVQMLWPSTMYVILNRLTWEFSWLVIQRSSSTHLFILALKAVTSMLSSDSYFHKVFYFHCIFFYVLRTYIYRSH